MTQARSAVEFDPVVPHGDNGIVRSRGRQAKAPWWLWLGALALVGPLLLAIGSLFLRVFDATPAAWDTLFSTRTLGLVWRSFALTATVTATACVLGVGGAWVLARTDIGFRRGWGVLIALPLVIPSYVLAMVIISATGATGLIADLTGYTFPSISGFVGSWIALSLSTYPYVYLITSAALTRVDPTLEDAARGLGATRTRVFRTVVLPQLRPAIGAGALLAALYTLSDFGAVSLMRFDTFTRAIYAQYSGRIDRSPAILLSIVLILLAAVIITAEWRTRGRGSIFTSSPSRSASRVRLSRAGRSLWTAGLAALVAVGTVVPIAVLGGWVLRGLANDVEFVIPWNAVVGSITGATLAAIVAMAFTIPTVVLIVRHQSKRTEVLEKSIFALFSLPHITIAIAVVAFTVTWLRPVYQSLGVLVAVYAAMFLAQSVSSAKSSLMAIDPTVDDASRSLGRGRFQTLWRVQLPLMRTGLLAGGALVFVTTLKELPVTLLLSPPGFSTLAVRTWAAADELLYTRAATAALILVAMSVIPVYFLSIRRRESVGS